MVSKWWLIARSCEFHGYRDSGAIARTIDDSLRELYPDDYHKYDVCKGFTRENLLGCHEIIALVGSVEYCVACNIDYNPDDGIGCKKCRFGLRHGYCDGVNNGSIIERFVTQLSFDVYNGTGWKNAVVDFFWNWNDEKDDEWY